MEPFEQGLRCQDIHSGLREIDSNAPALAPIEDTRLIGMAASLASAIRGQDVVNDAQILKSIAASELDVSTFAFNEIIAILDEAGFIHNVEIKSGKIMRFYETVPFHQNLYDTLGHIWNDRSPTELERELVSSIHRLARGPVAAEDLAKTLNIEPRNITQILQLAKQTSLINSVITIDGEILYSPFMAFENPEAIAEVLSNYGPDQFQEELDKVKNHQGLPIEPLLPALSSAVASGLIIAPSVQRPDGEIQPFACLPYSLNTDLFSVKKTILDKALAIVASVRCGQHFGGVTSIFSPKAILSKLAEGDHTLRAHSSASRQYQPLFRMQIVDFLPSGNWVSPRLIDTSDNLEAIQLALDLISFGESMNDRAGTNDARQLLLGGGQYLSPLRTMQNRRKSWSMSDQDFAKAIGTLMGRAAL